MNENFIHRIDSEKKENELIYSDNHIPNYEEQACCSNFLSSFGNNNVFGYINDVCFKDIPINDQELIDNININQEIKTPLCSNKKKITPNDDIIINNNNNNIVISNQNLIRNSLASNPSNDSAAEPIIPLRRTNTGNIEKDKDNNINGNNNSKKNFFANLADIFKDLFGDKHENDENNDISDKQSNNSNNILENIKRPVLRRILTNDKTNKIRINKNKVENRNNDIKNSSKEEEKEEKEIYLDDILNLKISENNDEDLTKLVSAIPAFIVKEKNKSKDNNNKYCPICLGEYMIGEKESSLPCLHCFHSNCIEKWLKRSKFCPVCKLTISWESLNPKFENDLV